MYPLKAQISERDHDACYSFVFRPHQGKAKFLPRTALALGCTPHEHFRLLIEGKNIKLPNGTIVKPEMVMSSEAPKA